MTIDLDRLSSVLGGLELSKEDLDHACAEGKAHRHAGWSDHHACLNGVALLGVQRTLRDQAGLPTAPFRMTGGTDK